jgi:hypothetical protein
MEESTSPPHPTTPILLNPHLSNPRLSPPIVLLFNSRKWARLGVVRSLFPFLPPTIVGRSLMRPIAFANATLIHSLITPDNNPLFTVDWALLSSDLDFIYLDPVLASHLEQQSELLVGKSLMSFVHPDEHASAKQDLGNVLESRTLHGSVTRYVITTHGVH